MPETKSPPTLEKVLVQNQILLATDVLRTGCNLPVSSFRRLHLVISGNGGSVANLKASILFGTPVGAVTLISGGTVWMESGVTAPVNTTFEYTAPANYKRTSFVLSVPVIAPLLYDVIIENMGKNAVPELYVTVMGEL